MRIAEAIASNSKFKTWLYKRLLQSQVLQGCTPFGRATLQNRFEFGIAGRSQKTRKSVLRLCYPSKGEKRLITL
jgi:hypothetical protein